MKQRKEWTSSYTMLRLIFGSEQQGNRDRHVDIVTYVVNGQQLYASQTWLTRHSSHFEILLDNFPRTLRPVPPIIIRICKCACTVQGFPRLNNIEDGDELTSLNQFCSRQRNQSCKKETQDYLLETVRYRIVHPFMHHYLVRAIYLMLLLLFLRLSYSF